MGGRGKRGLLRLQLLLQNVFSPSIPAHRLNEMKGPEAEVGKEPAKIAFRNDFDEERGHKPK